MGGTATKTQANTNSETQSNGTGGDDIQSILERHAPQARGGLPKSSSRSGLPALRQVLPGHQLPSLDPSSFIKQKSSTKRKEGAN